jgi:hypothetical protein
MNLFNCFEKKYYGLLLMAMKITPQLLFAVFIIVILIYIAVRVSIKSGFDATLRESWENPNIKKQILLYNGFKPGTKLDLFKMPGNVRITSRHLKIGDSGTGSGPFVYYRATVDPSWSGFKISNDESDMTFNFASNTDNVLKSMMQNNIDGSYPYNTLTTSYSIMPNPKNRQKPTITYTNVYASTGPQRDNITDNNIGGLIKQIIDLN